MIEVVPATMIHAARIHLREGDRREIEALGIEKMRAFELSFARSSESLAYLCDGEVAAIHGCGMSCMIGGYATPWFITGQPIERARKDLLRLSKARVHELNRRYGLLVNYVHAEYPEAIRLMKWIGFQIGAPVPLGPYGAPFVKVWMEAPDGH